MGDRKRNPHMIGTIVALFAFVLAFIDGTQWAMWVCGGAVALCVFFDFTA